MIVQLNILNRNMDCAMTLMDGGVEVEWDFSSTSHGKGDIDGLGGTCNQRVHKKLLLALLILKTQSNLLNTLLMYP